MVHARADDGEAERGVHCGVERERLHGNVALVVIHAHEGVGGLALPRQECGVRRQRAFDVVAARARLLDGGGDDALLLAVAEEAVLARVGIQPAHDELRLASADACEPGGGEFDHVEDAFLRQQRGHLRVADMHGDKRAGDLLGILHHA